MSHIRIDHNIPIVIKEKWAKAILGAKWEYEPDSRQLIDGYPISGWEPVVRIVQLREDSAENGAWIFTGIKDADGNVK